MPRRSTISRSGSASGSASGSGSRSKRTEVTESLHENERDTQRDLQTKVKRCRLLVCLLLIIMVAVFGVFAWQIIQLTKEVNDLKEN